MSNLSKEQEQYFKNSKVRDENGNLIICYHGTQTPGFTEFNPQHSDTSQFGKYKFDKYNVNYFTSDIDVAKGYTELGVGDVEGERKNIYACYLNIENPFIVDNKTESEFKKWSNIKDNRVRDKHIEAFEKFAKKWLHTWVDDSDVNAINKDLHFFNHELRPCADVDQDEDAIIYDLWELGNNSFFGAEHEVMRYYYIEELFSEDNYEELRDCLVGNYEEDREDYYYTIDNIVKWVLLMNEEDGTDYDGIIVPDIADVGPKGNPFSPYCTDYITLKSGNQIKDIRNINPTPKYNIHEDAGEKQIKIFKQIYNKIIQAEKYYGTPQWEDLLFSPLHCFIGAVLYAYHYSCKEKQPCIFHLGGFDNTATIISHCWIEDSSGRIHDTRGMSDKSRYNSLIEIPIDINTDALSIIKLVKAVVERKALVEELKESEIENMNINEALTKLNNLDESLLQDLHRDNQHIKKVYGEEVYQALQEYCEHGNDLGNVLYTESGWKRFEKWLFDTKGINIKEPNNYQILEDKNELKDRAKKHKKTDKKGAKGWFVNPNAGNVEYNISFFNHVMGSSSGESSSGEAMAEALNEDTKGFSSAIKNLISKLKKEYPDFTFVYNSDHKCVDMIKNDIKYAQIYPELDDELKDVTKSTLVRIYDKKDIQPSDIIYVKRTKKDSIKKYSSKNPRVKWVKKVGDKSLLNDICDELNATEIKEDLEKEDNVVFKGFTIEHFPYKFIGGGKTIEHNSYIIRSPYCLKSPENGDKYYLPLYCENKDGEVINFNTLDQAKEYITKYISKKAGTLKIKYSDEVHFVLDKNLNESKKPEYEELYYPHLTIEVVTREGDPQGYYDSYMGQWYPDDTETEERTIDWTYIVRKEYVEELILDLMEEEGLDTDLSPREFEELYDKYFDKYYDKILEAFEDEAKEDAEKNYKEEDYIDWDDYRDNLDEAGKTKEQILDELIDQYNNCEVKDSVWASKSAAVRLDNQARKSGLVFGKDFICPPFNERIIIKLTDKKIEKVKSLKEEETADKYFDIEVALRKANLNYNYDYNGKFYFESEQDFEKGCHVIKDINKNEFIRDEQNLCINFNLNSPETKIEEDIEEYNEPYASDVQKFVYRAIKALKLRSKKQEEYYAEMLEHDINNLRGDEWFEIFDKPKYASILAELKQLINYEEDEDDDLGEQLKFKKKLNENNSYETYYHSSSNPELSLDKLDWNKSPQIGLHVGTKKAAIDRNNTYFYELTIDKSKVKSIEAPHDMNYWYTAEYAQYIGDEKLLQKIKNILSDYIYERKENAYLESSKAYREYFLNKGINTITYKNDYEDIGEDSLILLDNSMIKSFNYVGETSKQTLDESIEKHDNLNPALWNEDKTLKDDVKQTLQYITDEFKKYLKENEIDINITDQVVVGSNANFNYTSDSDLDLHIVIGDVDEDTYKLYDAYKRLFNDKYEITIFDIPVEIYIEQNLDKLNSNGIYSLSKGWIKEPVQKEIPDLDQDLFDSHFDEYEKRYQELEPHQAEAFIDELYDLRQSSIENEGEFGLGNLIFKEFRNKGYLDKLKELRDEYISISLSLK